MTWREKHTQRHLVGQKKMAAGDLWRVNMSLATNWAAKRRHKVGGRDRRGSWHRRSIRIIDALFNIMAAVEGLRLFFLTCSFAWSDQCDKNQDSSVTNANNPPHGILPSTCYGRHSVNGTRVATGTEKLPIS
jgi:hypothetical protein